MTTVSTTKARTDLYKLIEVLQTGQPPVLITGKKGNAVLISEDEWRSISETLHLMSIPGMEKSILDASKEPLEKSARTIDL